MYRGKIINVEEKEMIPLANKEIKSYEKQKVCHICKKSFVLIKTKKPPRDHCHYIKKFRGAAHSECNLRYKALKEIPVSSIVCEFIGTVFFFIKHILSLKYTKQ